MDHGCRRCMIDAECASAVCDASAGTCVAETDIAYASPNGIDLSPCTQANPCSITHAFAVTSASRRTVKLEPGSYTAAIQLTNKTVTVHGFNAMVTAPPTNAAVEVNDNASLTLQGVAIVSQASAGAIRCEGANASLTLDQVNVEASGIPVFANPCSAIQISQSHLHTPNASRQVFFAGAPSNATIERSTLDGGDGVVAAGAGAVVRITNSVISNQTGSDGAFGYSAFTSSKGVIFVSFSTILNSLVKCNDSVACVGGSARGLCIDNSIISNSKAGVPADTITGVGCQANFTLIAPQQTAPAGANNFLGVNPLFVNAAAGDLHLQTVSPAIDAADPTASNPVDLDGTTRPQGTTSDLGALERAQ
jgi:hypothetical protein